MSSPATAGDTGSLDIASTFCPAWVTKEISCVSDGDQSVFHAWRFYLYFVFDMCSNILRKKERTCAFPFYLPQIAGQDLLKIHAWPVSIPFMADELSISPIQLQVAGKVRMETSRVQGLLGFFFGSMVAHNHRVKGRFFIWWGTHGMKFSFPVAKLVAHVAGKRDKRVCTKGRTRDRVDDPVHPWIDKIVLFFVLGSVGLGLVDESTSCICLCLKRNYGRRKTEQFSLNNLLCVDLSSRDCPGLIILCSIVDRCIWLSFEHGCWLQLATYHLSK